MDFGLSLFARYLLKFLLLPPAINLLVILLAFVFLYRWRAFRNLVISLSLISLCILSLPVASYYLASHLERYSPLDLERTDIARHQAIVILGAGRYRQPPEYPADVSSGLGLERLQYGAFLQRKTGLPILVTGGKWPDDEGSEADFMARILEREFMASVRWREDQSRTTWENAVLSRPLLAAHNIDKILLVTHAWHMPRALDSFKRAGFEVTPAPTRFVSHDAAAEGLFFVPSAAALHSSSRMLHEMLGLLWYRWAY